MRRNLLLRRGDYVVEPLRGKLNYNPKRLGGVPKIRPIYRDFTAIKPQRPIRALVSKKQVLPVLYNKADQLMNIHNALALRRSEYQLEQTYSRLEKGILHSEYFINKYMLEKSPVQDRPSMHTLWFGEKHGLVNRPDILHSLPTYDLIPLFSIIPYDYESGVIDAQQVEDLYTSIMDLYSCGSKRARRELCNSTIRVFVLSGQIEKAERVIHEMKRRKIRRDFITYAPLFRAARKNIDVDLHLRITQLCIETEGSRLLKLLYIDIPRVLYVFGAYFRYTWDIYYWLIGMAFWVYVIHVVLKMCDYM